MSITAYPTIIQGGMGIGVSGWRLARAVSMAGQLGVVSGAALTAILTRRLQLGDPDGHMRRALEHFPVQRIAQAILDRYFVPGGLPPDQDFELSPLPHISSDRKFDELATAASFVEIFLAKEGHSGLVGLNLLEKVQIPTLPMLYGAMLAGVDYVLMGAGIPLAIPGALDALAAGKTASLKIAVVDQAAEQDLIFTLDPHHFLADAVTPLKRPNFLAIISSSSIATIMSRKANGRVDGFVIETATAGGHNAPPRGPLQLSDRGEPVYGPRDLPDVPKIQSLGLPFWMAGSYADPARLAEARQLGATGVQIGTAFAFCEESGLDPQLKQRVIQQASQGKVEVFTDPYASPTGFPFKVVQLESSLSEQQVYEQRQRRCDIGYLRDPYARPDGTIGYRCAAEPVEQYVRKGGDIEDTVGRKCLCNALVNNVGLGEPGTTDVSRVLLTSGSDLQCVTRFLKPGQTSYTAADVVRHLLG